MFIAYNANIEDAVGTQNNDVIFGNQLGNSITGGEGNDILYGEGGQDTYIFDDNYGDDIIDDSDGSGQIKIDGQTIAQLAGDSIMSGEDDAPGELWWIGTETSSAGYMELHGSTLSIFLGKHYDGSDFLNSITIENFKNDGGMGFTLGPINYGSPGGGGGGGIGVVPNDPDNPNNPNLPMTPPEPGAPPTPPALPGFDPKVIKIGPSFDHPPASPLIIDLNRNSSIELTALTDTSKAFFDLDADGFVEQTGWVQAGDALLAIDSNANGIIDDINELFGNSTTDGFIELAALDSDSNDVINANDSLFGDLLVWVDADGDGHSDAGELQTLTEAGIASIGLNYTTVNGTNQGHDVSTQSTVTFSDSSTALIQDIWFQHNQAHSFYVKPEDFLFDPNVLDLPQLRGSGDVTDLWTAMSLDGDLKTAVETLTEADYSSFSFAGFRSDVEAIAFNWFGVGGVNPTSRGTHIDARVLEGLEAYMGRDYVQNGQPDPRTNAGAQLTTLWDELIDVTAVRMLVQIPTFALSEAIVNAGTDYDYIAANLTSDFPALIDAIEGEEPTGSTEKQAYWYDLLPLINAVADSVAVTDADYITALTGTYLDTITSESLDNLRTNTIQLGTDGNDTLTGSAVTDYFLGGKGDDLLEGSTGGNHSGNDIYQYYLGDGNDTIDDVDISSSDSDVVLFGPGIALGDLAFSRDGSDLLIDIAGGGSILIDGQFGSHWYEIENLQFDDGSFYSAAQIRAELLVPTSGNDTIVGYETDDTLTGGAGDDLLKGSGGGNHSGNDTYLYYSGDGNDTIDDTDISSTDADRLVFGPGITAGQLFFSKIGNDLIIDAPGGGSVTIDRQFHSNGWYEIEQIEFQSDSTIIAASEIQDIIDNGGTMSGGSGNPITGTNSGETLNGTSDADVITALAGNDDIYAGDGNDTVSSGAGDDYIELGAGNDVILLTLTDSSSADGVDYVGDFTQGQDKLDVSAMGYTDVSEFSVYQDSSYTEIYDNANGFAIGFASGTLTLTNADFIFAGGGAPNNDPTLANAIVDQNATEGSAFSFQFASNTFSDADAGDTLSYSATKSDGTALPSWLSFNASTRTFSGTPLDANVGILAVKVTASDGHGGTPATDIFNITVANINNAPTVANAITNQNATEDAAFSFQFASNTFADADAGDTLTYSATLNGGGSLPSWLSFNASTRTFSGTPDAGDVGTIAVKVTANDGNGGTIDDVFDLTVAADSGPSFDNTITGGSSAETLTGGSGNDLIQGLGGNDEIYGEEGHDSLEGGNGADVIYGWTGNDTIDGGAGNDEIGGDGGNDLLIGGNGNDDMFGDAGSDILIGGAGSDYLEGGADADIFKYTALGDSTASLTDYIGDFVHGTDKLDLSGLGFTGIQSGAASGTTLGYTSGGGYTEISNAAGTFFIGFNGNLTFDSGDFIFS